MLRRARPPGGGFQDRCWFCAAGLTCAFADLLAEGSQDHPTYVPLTYRTVCYGLLSPVTGVGPLAKAVALDRCYVFFRDLRRWRYAGSPSRCLLYQRRDVSSRISDRAGV